jgi:hypothetical protein
MGHWYRPCLGPRGPVVSLSCQARRIRQARTNRCLFQKPGPFLRFDTGLPAAVSGPPVSGRPPGVCAGRFAGCVAGSRWGPARSARAGQGRRKHADAAGEAGSAACPYHWSTACPGRPDAAWA